MGLPAILEERAEDPSWLGLNRWWFLTYSFPLGMLTQEALHSLREQQKFHWKIRWGRVGEGNGHIVNFENGQVLLCQQHWVESEPCQITWWPWSQFLLSNRWVCCTHFKSIESTTVKLSHLLFDWNSASLWKKGAHWWIRPELSAISL